MHVQNERNFPQAKLDTCGKINVLFLLNEHAYGDQYFLLHNNNVSHVTYMYYPL